MRGDGSSNEERLRTGRRYRTDRTEGISDGVFAVSTGGTTDCRRPPRRDTAWRSKWASRLSGVCEMGTWLFEPGHTAAMFRARHMMVTYVRGHFKNVSGSLAFDPENSAHSSADVAIDAAAIWTGQPQRDAHLHQFVDTRKKCR